MLYPYPSSLTIIIHFTAALEESKTQQLLEETEFLSLSLSRKYRFYVICVMLVMSKFYTFNQLKIIYLMYFPSYISEI